GSTQERAHSPGAWLIALQLHALPGRGAQCAAVHPLPPLRGRLRPLCALPHRWAAPLPSSCP
ncbi:unnamed protein product, partial [Closterium sp. NIES-53]